MQQRLNVTLIGFLKSLLAISVLYVLLAIGLSFVGMVSFLNFYSFIAFSLVALVVCSCNLLPSKNISLTLKILLSLLGVMVGALYLPLDFDILLSSQFSTSLYIYIATWIVTSFVAIRSGSSSVDSFEFYEKSVKFFKSFLIFVVSLVLIGLLALIFVDYQVIENAIMNASLYIFIYTIVGLALIKTSRNVIYTGVKPLNSNKAIIKYVIYSATALGTGAVIFIFRQKLDKAFYIFINGLKGIYSQIITAFNQVVDFFKKVLLQAGIDASTEVEQLPETIPNEVIDEVLNDFGIDPDFKLEPDDIPEDLGGIGSIGGINDSVHVGASDFYSYAGLIGSAISESGSIGIGQGEGTVTGNASAIALVRSEKDAILYLKLKSFGDYNKKGWDDANESGFWIENKDSGMNYLTGLALSGRYNNGKAIKIDISSLTKQYFLPDYIAMGEYDYVKQASDVVNTLVGVDNIDSTDYVYSMAFYDEINHYINSNIPYKYQEIEKQYSQYVHQNYLQLPTDTRENVLDFLSQNGILIGDNDAVEKVFNLLSSYTYNLEYDKTLDTQDDVVLSFLKDYKQGSCQHFASAGVVMLRALGYPARYVGGLSVGQVKAGEWMVVTSNASHAWVEIYQDKVGWVRLDFTEVAISQENRFKKTYTKDEYKEIINQYKEDILANPEGGESDSGNGDGESGDSGSQEGGGSDQEGGDEESGEGNEEGENSSGEQNQGMLIGCDSAPIQTVTIVGASLMVATVVVLIIVSLKRKPKNISKFTKINRQKTSKEKLEILQKQETKMACQIIRDNYRTMIKIIGKNGVKRYPIDTTESIRAKYCQSFGVDDAIQIITSLYQVVRYDKNQVLTVKDAMQSSECLAKIKSNVEKKRIEKLNVHQ